jgi:anti-anti-sigma regulatory factor
MNCNLEQSEEAAEIFVSGVMSIEDAADLKTALSCAIAGSSCIVIDLSATDATDISCLQVICSAHRAAVLSGKKLTVRGIDDSFITCLEDAGFPRHTGCLQQNGVPCLWQERKQN